MNRRQVSSAISWLACGLLVALWWGQTGNQWDTPVAADMMASGGGFTLLSANSRDQRVAEESEVLYLLDHHRGMMLVYGLRDVHTNPYIEMLDGGLMEVLFERARQASRRQKP